MGSKQSLPLEEDKRINVAVRAEMALLEYMVRRRVADHFIKTEKIPDIIITSQDGVVAKSFNSVVIRISD